MKISTMALISILMILVYKDFSLTLNVSKGIYMDLLAKKKALFRDLALFRDFSLEATTACISRIAMLLGE